MKNLICFITALWMSSSSFGQEIEYTQNPFAYSYDHPSPTFKNIFSGNPFESFSVYKPVDYVPYKVQKISVYDDKKNLWYQAVLDTAGNIVTQGRRGTGFFITSERLKTGQFNFVSITTYLKDGVKHRIDSMFIHQHSYVSGDTVLSYSTKRIKKYYLGSLINEQNVYYNDRYKDRSIREYEEENSSRFEVLSPTPPQFKKNEVYFKKDFPSDFTEDSLYFYSDYQWDTEQQAASGRYSMEYDSYINHPFFKDFGKSNFNQFEVAGAEFDEPVFLQESMWCGNSIYSQQHYYDGRNSGVTRNNDGLITEFWEDYYPEDPNPKPRPEPDPNDEELDIPLIDMGQDVQRLSTPIRTIKHTVSYTYFK